MRYLTFDIECCDGRNICEFGYVITDESFKMVEKDVFTVNPEKPFRLTGRKNQDDLTLFYPEEVYYASPTFPKFYERIKSLLTAKDQIIVGHAVGNDAGFLRNACKRYGLDPINFDFVDSQKIYKEFTNDKESISLERAEKTFDLSKPQYLHKSDDDALLTIELVEKICSVLEMSLTEVICLCPTACGKSHNFNVQYTGNSLSSMLSALAKNENTLSQSKKKLCIQKFSEKVQAEGKIIKNRFTNTKLCFSSSYEKNHIKDALVLIQLLANCGCKYNSKVSENDYYVATDEELTGGDIDNHTRYHAALHNKGGRNVTVLSFDELFEILGLTPDSLSKHQMPKAPKRKENRKRVYSAGYVSNTIGAHLKSKGIDLLSLFDADA